MKTLTTMTAVAALIAGISIASAQNGTNNDQNAAPNSINKGALAKPESGSQKMNPGTSSGKQAQSGQMGRQVASGRSKFCVETTPGGALDCKYASMAACEKDAKPQNHLCQPNPNMGGTTGSKQ